MYTRPASGPTLRSLYIGALTRSSCSLQRREIHLYTWILRCSERKKERQSSTAQHNTTQDLRQLKRLHLGGTRTRASRLQAWCSTNWTTEAAQLYVYVYMNTLTLRKIEKTNTTQHNDYFLRDLLHSGGTCIVCTYVCEFFLPISAQIKSCQWKSVILSHLLR